MLTIASVLLTFVGQYINLKLLPGLDFSSLPLVSDQLIGIFNAIGLLTLFSGLVSSAGLIFFKPWARTVNLVATASGLAAYPMVEYFVSAGLKTSTDQLSTLLGGAVLGAAYWSPISERFARQKPAEHLPQSSGEA